MRAKKIVNEKAKGKKNTEYTRTITYIDIDIQNKKEIITIIIRAMYYVFRKFRSSLLLMLLPLLFL